MRRQTEARRRDRYHPPPLHLILIQPEDDGRQNITSRWSSRSPMGIDLTGPGRCPFWAVKTGKAQCEHMFSALPPKADVAQRGRHVRFVPLPEVARLFDHLVGAAGKQPWRHLEPSQKR